ncbi:MAG: exodeoxyribonuclease VII small subunit [Candidatus Nomurabacteria bacterium]|jgi:exodeoxyribonuclease VII small subunit|nr:exodeoxyribonuclease VII small subunit [Candidatus Nomurabacteria bacterium]
MSKANKSIKELMDEFESVVAWFEADEIDVEKAITQYEKGAKLADEIKKQLSDAKNRIEVLNAKS